MHLFQTATLQHEPFLKKPSCFTAIYQHAEQKKTQTKKPPTRGTPQKVLTLPLSAHRGLTACAPGDTVR